MKGAARVEPIGDVETGSGKVDAAAVDDADVDDAVAALIVPTSSGLYCRRSGTRPSWSRQDDELRLDVDGRYPQMVASGVHHLGTTGRLHWIAHLTSTARLTWSGQIFYRDGTSVLPVYTDVTIAVAYPHATVVFSAAGASSTTLVYTFVSRGFDRVEFEFDSTVDAKPALEFQTHSHPNRPSGLADELLSVRKVYERAGFDVGVAPVGAMVPLEGAGIDGAWSETEMHDAMQAHWSRFANQAQWAMWVFHARLHEVGASRGGMMFDDIGPNHRQGAAVFTDSFIANAPAGDTSPAAWVTRMRFWTLCHEMGHAFNLAHSWQKTEGMPWIPQETWFEARSFMNYPYKVAGGSTAFFSDFAFRFSDEELLFMRHAPRRFVQMGNADWFDQHAFDEAAVSPEPKLALSIRVNRPRPLLQFLEPAMIELKIVNVSAWPLLVPQDILLDVRRLTLVIKRNDHPARLWQPYANELREPAQRLLQPGEAMYAPIFVGAGKNGWLVAEPGRYRLQACLRLPDGEDVVSPELTLRVATPEGDQDERVAQDLFNHNVGRVFAFDGTRELIGANDALEEAIAALPTRLISTHARIALGMPLRRVGKVLRGTLGRPAVDAVAGQPDKARKLLGDALLRKQSESAATLGHIEYREYVEAYANWLAREGEFAAAKNAIAKALATLHQRDVEPAVVAQMRALMDVLSAKGGASRRRGR